MIVQIYVCKQVCVERNEFCFSMGTQTKKRFLFYHHIGGINILNIFRVDYLIRTKFSRYAQILSSIIQRINQNGLKTYWKTYIHMYMYSKYEIVFQVLRTKEILLKLFHFSLSMGTKWVDSSKCLFIQFKGQKFQ